MILLQINGTVGDKRSKTWVFVSLSAGWKFLRFVHLLKSNEPFHVRQNSLRKHRIRNMFVSSGLHVAAPLAIMIPVLKFPNGKKESKQINDDSGR